MALRELLLKLGIDVDKKGAANADRTLKTVKRAAGAAAAAFAAIKAGKALLGVTDEVRALGDELDKTSKQIGLSTDALQELRFAAGLAGVEGNEMSNALAKLQKNANEAGDGSATMADDFKKLGISVKDANGELKTGEQLFLEMADGMQNLDNDSEKVALSMNLMGRSGRKLLPLFEDGAEGIEAMRQEARELGGVMSQDLIDASVKLTDDQFRLSQAWQGVKNTIATALMPAITSLVNVFIRVAKAVKGPVSVAFRIIKNVFDGMAMVIGFLNDKMDGLGTVLAVITTALGVLGVALFIFGKTALISGIMAALPWLLWAIAIIAVIALIGLIIEDLVVFAKGGDSLIGRLINGFKKWVKQMGGVGAAIGKIFEKIFRNVFGLSEETARNIAGVFVALGEAVVTIFDKIGTFIGESIAAIVIFFQNMWQGFKDVIGFMWGAVTGFVEGFVGVFQDAINAILDSVGELLVGFTEALGITNLGEEEAARQANVKRIEVAQKKQARLNRQKAEKRSKALVQLEQEGFGTFQPGERGVKGSGFAPSGDEAAAQQRFEQILSGDTNITVSVDAANKSNPGAIGDAVASKIDKAQNTRQTQQAFQTQPL